jgi:hypothetical protein
MALYVETRLRPDEIVSPPLDGRVGREAAIVYTAN